MVFHSSQSAIWKTCPDSLLEKKTTNYNSIKKFFWVWLYLIQLAGQINDTEKYSWLDYLFHFSIFLKARGQSCCGIILRSCQCHIDDLALFGPGHSWVVLLWLVWLSNFDRHESSWTSLGMSVQIGVSKSAVPVSLHMNIQHEYCWLSMEWPC